MQFLRHMKIGKKLMLSFATMVVVSLLMAIFAFSSIQDIKTSAEDTDRARELGHTYQIYQKAFSEQRQHLLSYLLTGDRRSLQNYNDLQEVAGKELAKLKQKSSSSPELTALVNQLSNYKGIWTGQYAEQQISLMRNYLTVNQARAIEVTGLPSEVVADFEKVAQVLADKLDAMIHTSIVRQEAALDRFTMVIVVSLACLVLVAVLFGFSLTRVIAGPIERITDRMAQLADGKLDIDNRGADRRDEIGAMARAVEVFKLNAIEQKELQARDAELQQQERFRHEKMDKLARDFDQKMEAGLEVVSNSVNDVMDAASTMAGNAVETGTLSQNASTAIEETSGNIQTVSAASTELSSSIGEISRQMAQASEVARAAVSEVEQTNSRVIELNEAAKSIGEVVQIISVIAEQTNLLALNATIEAARAGEAGKGFAVVASEVKNLANQTAKATDEIGLKVSEIQNETGSAAEAVLAIGETIRKIDELTAVVASAVEEQGAATSEIARNVDEAAQGAGEVSSVVQSVAVAADETGKLADQQRAIVESLQQNNEALKADIGTFLSSVKSLS